MLAHNKIGLLGVGMAILVTGVAGGQSAAYADMMCPGGMMSAPPPTTPVMPSNAMNVPITSTTTWTGPVLFRTDLDMTGRPVDRCRFKCQQALETKKRIVDKIGEEDRAKVDEAWAKYQKALDQYEKALRESEQKRAEIRNQLKKGTPTADEQKAMDADQTKADEKVDQTRTDASNAYWTARNALRDALSDGDYQEWVRADAEIKDIKTSFGQPTPLPELEPLTPNR